MIQGVLVSDLTQSCEDGTLELELESLCRHNSHGDGGQCGYSLHRGKMEIALFSNGQRWGLSWSWVE